MSYLKYIKDIRIETGEFYIAKQISKYRYRVIYKKGIWYFPDKEILIMSFIYETNDGKYKAKEITKQEAFLEMI